MRKTFRYDPEISPNIIILQNITKNFRKIKKVLAFGKVLLYNNPCVTEEQNKSSKMRD